MFFKKRDVDPFPVHDKVVFHNVDKEMEIKVKGDDKLMVVNLQRANKRLSGLSDSTEESEQRGAALMFAEAIMGKEQAEKLLAFYDNDPLVLITACGRYFQYRLKHIITKAQKK